MSTASEEILARYRKVEREADVFGRIIGVRKLNPSQQLKVMEFTNSEQDSVKTALFAAASVCEIDARPVTFPRNRGELDSIINMLDQEGLEAVSKALNTLLGSAPPPETGPDGEIIPPETEDDIAKKSQGTAHSEMPSS